MIVLYLSGSLSYRVSFTKGEDREATTRQLAGLHIKNLLVAKDEALQAEKHNRWKAMPPDQRSAIKQTILSAIRSPGKAWPRIVEELSGAFVTLSTYLKYVCQWKEPVTQQRRLLQKSPQSNCPTMNGRNFFPQ